VQYPWMTLLLTSGGSPYCGGVLISSTVVMTAAHCSEPVSVMIGGLNWASQPSAFETIAVSGSTIRDDYNSNTYFNDIRLVYLSQASTKTPIKLNTDESNENVGTVVRIAGWGTIAYGLPGMVSALRQADIDILANAQCSAPYSNFVSSVMICAGVTAGGRDTCQGDSGGPLFLQLADGNYTSIGITSYGEGCAQVGFPGVYTRTRSYSTWIAENQTYSPSSFPVVAVVVPIAVVAGLLILAAVYAVMSRQCAQTTRTGPVITHAQPLRY
jgi:trypsin